MEFVARLKPKVKKVLSRAGLFLTPNQRYDHYTSLILQRVLHSHSCVVDVGAYRGEFLDEVLALAPQGNHIAVEPLPFLAKRLREKYRDRPVRVYECALAETPGQSSFCYVPEAPAYSGLKPREYPRRVKAHQTLNVSVQTLDSLLPAGYCPDLVKIDVEGAEWPAMRGASDTLSRCRPLLLFECGLGASERYGTHPEDLARWLEERGYRLYTLPGFLNGEMPLTIPQFSDHFHRRREYYFVASHYEG